MVAKYSLIRSEYGPSVSRIILYTVKFGRSNVSLISGGGRWNVLMRNLYVNQRVIPLQGAVFILAYAAASDSNRAKSFDPSFGKSVHFEKPPN